MSPSPLPLILIEVVLVFGGVLVFAWWQLRSVARDRAKAPAERSTRSLDDQAPTPAPADPPAPAPPPTGPQVSPPSPGR